MHKNDFRDRKYDPLDNRDVEIRFFDINIRGRSKAICHVEVVQLGAGNANMQTVYPIGSSWEDVKNKYPSFDDLLYEIGGLTEFGSRLVPANFEIAYLEGHDDLFDVPHEHLTRDAKVVTLADESPFDKLA